MIRVAVMGAAGYLGGELLRLLTGHPGVEVVQAVSTRFPGRRVDSVHPNLRAQTELVFSPPDEPAACDVLFTATPHRTTMTLIPGLRERAGTVIDLSGDFRLPDPAVYERYYGVAHAAPELLGAFVPGIPELYRDELRTADLISVPGCMATAAILALRPLAGLVEPDVQIDGRTGSSGSGALAGDGNLHAERSGAMRVFAPVGHRHEAEVSRLTGLNARMSATGVEAVRGVQVVCHATHATGKADERTVRRAYRDLYADEPFVRIVAHRRGTHRLPDPKLLSGSNYCDVGFAVDGDRITAIAALDNLVKGGAGAAVQCLNLRTGQPETLGLGFPGLHPI
ncbi:N-acetyl-gamma-glutamyl-phosphate reductase [Actinomadura rupiterrae]|uniref:N-acetyl-gamma-glutamyl-phosphate reductase n=1 Tax=Actinomadura rupiterrae TaxID=559627 RepID=UPI0020A25BE0|nr:N-acetyl-gamma-glutamyl-phosphate reductase [Actinomadura rupiterrae]MCP2342423.1 N-acetyl-gamma-glutamyl-phosphate/LysW-gamma-L-alpha-aminoadipyl-6-phosphate reductase [Actinomadura rupiterrae]